MLRGEGRIALACATTGIASMLLTGSTTAHSRFGVLLPVGDEFTSNINVTSERARVIEEAAIII